MIEATQGNAYRGAAGQAGEWMFCILTFQLVDGRIRDIRFRTPGCPRSLRAAETLCRLAEGRELATMRTLTAAELLRVAPMPEGKEDACDHAGIALVNGKPEEP